MLIPLAASNGYLVWRAYARNLSAAIANETEIALDLARATKVFVEETLAIQRSTGKALGSSHWYTSEARGEYVRSIQKDTPQLRSLAFADLSGRVTDASPITLLGTNISSQSYFHTIIHGADWTLSDLRPTPGNPRPGFIVASGIRSNGKLVGVAIAIADEARLMSEFRLDAAAETHLVLLDSFGQVTFTSHSPHLPFSQSHWEKYRCVQGALGGRIERVRSLRVPGEPELTGAIAPVSGLGWAAGAFEPTDKVLGPTRKMTYGELAIAVALVLLALLIGSLVSKQMVAPVTALSRAAAVIGRGQLDSRAPVPRIPELATLAKTMNSMAESLQQRDESLRQALGREKRISDALQSRMLPEVPSRIGRMELACGYFPALDEADLGGDFYDVMFLPNGLLGIVVGDVSGKGLAAAVYTAMVKYMLEGFAYEDPRPSTALTRVNRIMREASPDARFVTVFFGVVNAETGEMIYVSAGHPPPICRRANGSTTWLEMPTGPPLGVTDAVDYTENCLVLSEGDSLVCYTDGVTEARHGSFFFGEERLKEFIKDEKGRPSQVVGHLHDLLSDFVDGRLQDDVALLVASFGSSVTRA